MAQRQRTWASGELNMASTAPSTRRWTRAESYQLAELGLFRGQRVELLGGNIVVLSPQKFPHAAATDEVAEVLRGALGAGVWVRAQLPLTLGPWSEPEPDVSVVAGARTDYTDHPATALLIVEISDTTLRYDRGRKANRYARAGVADYWILNLVDRQLEVRRNPVPDPSQRFGFRYADISIRFPPDRVAPLVAPSVQIAVADLFP
jgi:Uma2 family endonuclease